MRKQRGITLIALVITIIILIILAGVAINLTLGERGISNKAKYAKERYLNAQLTEESELRNSTNLIDSYLSDNQKLTAEIVGFTPDISDTTITYDDNWKAVRNVKEALDYLYNI